MPHDDQNSADGEKRVVYGCASRDDQRGALVVVLTWQDDEAALAQDAPTPDATAVMAGTGFYAETAPK